MSAAASELFLSQPAISLQIRALEEALDATLFERRGRTIKLTPEGQELLKLAEPLMDGLGGLKDAFEEKRGRLEGGELNIAAGESTILYLLPELVRAYRKLYPKVHVHLHNVTGRDGLAMIRSDEVDFAVGSMLDVPVDIEYDPAYSFKPVLIMPEGHPLEQLDTISLADIGQYDLILPPRRLTTFRTVDMVFRHYNIPYHVTLEAGGWEVIKRYVSLGLGISIVTSICLTDDDKLLSRDMSGYFQYRSYGTVIRRGKYLTPQANRFIELIRPA